MGNGRDSSRPGIACGALLAAILTQPGGAQPSDAVLGTEAAEGPRSCLPHPTIRRTTILNNRNIVFITRQDAIYHNELPRECPSLSRRSLVNFAVDTGRVCAGDRFQVLLEMAPKDFLPGPLCELGAFVPITETELEDLTAMTDENRERSRRGRSKRESVTTQQVELPREPAAPAPAESAPAEQGRSE